MADKVTLERWPGYTGQSWQQRFAHLDREHRLLEARLSSVLTLLPTRSSIVEECAKVAECVFDDRGRNRVGHPSQMDWEDGYREATQAAAAALQSTPDTRAKIVAFIRRRASEIVNGLSTGVGAHDPIWTVSAYMHGLANDIAGEDGALTPMPDTRAIVAETVERCWRAAWAAEPLPEAPVSLQDRPLFNYGRDCAVAAIRASAAPEEGK